jgi:membrane peptidoglycan carboxypeptidase
MKRAVLIRKARAARELEHDRVRRAGRIGLLIAITLLAISAGALSIIGLGLSSLTSDLPDIARIEAQFGPRGAEQFHPLIALDRSAEHLLWELSHPGAAGAQWVSLGELPQHVLETTVQAIDPSFWSNSGYQLQGFIVVLDLRPADSITIRLVKTALQPIADLQLNSASRELRARMLAAELSRRYQKEQILTWFLNSANYGNGIYGVDAAALTYFDKHAEALALEESLVLASLLVDRESATASRLGRNAIELLRAMPHIPSSEFPRIRAAIYELDLSLLSPVSDQQGFRSYVMQQLQIALGEWAIHRSGLRVTTTLDLDLQRQVECAAHSHVERISGGSVGAILPARDGSTCVAATLLPALRPKDAGVDQHVAEFGVLVTDPKSGEMLALVGDPNRAISPGSTLAPFVYLSAFSKGSGPGTIVLDIAAEADHPAPSHGPVRMRTALANGYPHASLATLELVGKDNFLRTMRQMGLPSAVNYADLPTVEINAGEQGLRLQELAQGYGVIANRGLLTTSSAEELIAFSRVEEIDGTVMLQVEATERVVLSPQLAYLLVDVLSDNQARDLGQSRIFQIGRPAAMLSSSASELREDLAIGFTPRRLALVWLDGPGPMDLDISNGAAAIWHAVLRFATKDLQPEAWTIPAGVNELEVCDPSGLLPTAYCPQIVRELFIQGTEPTSYDNLYVPVRINRETGKLATLFTPLELIDELVFFIPAVGAEQWALDNGIPQPPEQYDTVYEKLVTDPLVDIRSPTPFATLSGAVSIIGDARSEGMDYFRLQFGQGLDPSHWIQIGEDNFTSVRTGRLGMWETLGLDGLFTLQLVAVGRDGVVKTAALPVAVDNTPPRVQILSPFAGQALTTSATVAIQVDAIDSFGIARVEILIDGRQMTVLEDPPYLYLWQTGERSRTATIQALAIDQAGNSAESEVVTVAITD